MCGQPNTRVDLKVVETEFEFTVPDANPLRLNPWKPFRSEEATNFKGSSVFYLKLKPELGISSLVFAVFAAQR